MIAADLEKCILGGEFSRRKFPSTRQLAQLYQTNRLTVRKAFSLLERRGLVQCVSRRRGFELVGGDAKNLRHIGYVMIRPYRNSFHAQSVLFLEREAANSDANLSFYRVEEVAEVEKNLLPRLRAARVDGLVLTGRIQVEMLGALRKTGLPVVLSGHLLYEDPKKYEVDHVIIDSVDYACRATHHVLAAGAKKPLLLRGPSWRWFRNMEEGFMRALRERGIPFRENMVLRCEEDTPEDAEILLDAFLQMSTTDGIVAGNDGLAWGALRALRRHGKRIPDDVKLFGFGDTELATLAEVPLSTFRVERETLARELLDLLAQRLANPKAEAERRVVAVHEVERASCPVTLAEK
jgi:LacI family transcriptional regulator